MIAVKPAEVKAAVTYQDVKVYEVNEMTNFDGQIGLSWEHQMSLNESTGVKKQEVYGKFTLSKDSIVRIKCFVRERDMLDSNDLFALYSNVAMASPILEQDFGSISG